MPTEYKALTPGKKVVFNDVGITAVPVDHQIPASGVLLEINGQSIVFTGDTGPTGPTGATGATGAIFLKR